MPTNGLETYRRYRMVIAVCWELKRFTSYEVKEKTRLPQTTIYRMIKELEKHGYIQFITYRKQLHKAEKVYGAVCSV